MKNKILITLLITFMSLFIFTNHISATDMFTYKGVLYNEDIIYEKFTSTFSDLGFDINVFSNIYCYKDTSSNYHCYALNNDFLENMYLKQVNDITYIYSGQSYFNGRAGFYLNIKSSSISSGYSWNSNYNIIYDEVYANFYFPGITNEQKSKIVKIDFSKYTESTEDDEPEINIKANKLLTFVIDKTKNIYELIINNPMLLFIISIPLVYICFLIIYKIFKR